MAPQGSTFPFNLEVLFLHQSVRIQALFLKWQWWFLFLTAGSSPTQNLAQASQTSLTTPTNFLSSFYTITCCKMLSMLSLKVIRLPCSVPAQVITVRFSLLWVVELLTADTSRIKAPSPRPSVCFKSLFVLFDFKYTPKLKLPLLQMHCTVHTAGATLCLGSSQSAEEDNCHSVRKKK